jgi:hypothetical protein
MNELDGFSGLGMADEVIKMARRLLGQPRLSAADFQMIIIELLIHTDHPGKWKPRIERAYGFMSALEKRKAFPILLMYYGTIGDYKTAVQYTGSLHMPEHFLFAMWTFLALNRIDDADELARRCMKMLKDQKDNPSDALLQALGCYFARKGDFERAREMWAAMPMQSALLQNALTGIVESYLVQAWLAAHAGLAVLQKLTREANTETELVIPGNHAAVLRNARKGLLDLKKAIAKALPANRRKKFGIQTIIEQKDAKSTK